MKYCVASVAIMAGGLALPGPALDQELPRVSVQEMTVPDYDPMAGAKMP